MQRKPKKKRGRKRSLAYLYVSSATEPDQVNPPHAAGKRPRQNAAPNSCSSRFLLGTISVRRERELSAYAVILRDVRICGSAGKFLRQRKRRKELA